jgi:hypothetical protein
MWMLWPFERQENYGSQGYQLTHAVTRCVQSQVMETARLQPGSQIHCLHCRRWHPVRLRHMEGTEYTRAMLYWQCRGLNYYAGQVGGQSRYQTRRPRTHHAPTVGV